MTNEHTSLEKYTSHTLFERAAKGLQKGCVWEVSWRLNRLQHIDPQVPLGLAALLSHSADCSTGGPEGSALCWELVLTASNSNKLTPTNSTRSGTGFYNCLTSTCFLWASHLHRIQPVHGQGDTLIFSTGAPVIYTGASFNWQLARGSICNTNTKVYLLVHFICSCWEERETEYKYVDCFW